MDERVRFVGRLLDAESMSEACRQFGISRKTGYKIWGRYKEEGLPALAAAAPPERRAAPDSTARLDNGNPDLETAMESSFTQGTDASSPHR